MFDVSHMGQLVLDAPPQALESLVPADLEKLAPGHAVYTVLTSTAGGIHDDLIIARERSGFRAVVNAACRNEDAERFANAVAGAGTVRLLEDWALLALQGPAAEAVLTPLCEPAPGIRFMQTMECRINAVPCMLSRSGYTGEDGFEIALGAEHAEALASILLADERVQPAGLGARDSLRLEAGLCLAGCDFDAQTNVVAAGLGWTVARKYRHDNAQPGRFPGAEAILRALETGTPQVRVGLRPEGRRPLRGGARLVDDAGHVVGVITSGSFGATVGHPVAMGYVDAEIARAESQVFAVAGQRRAAAHVVGLPFVAHRYRR